MPALCVLCCVDVATNPSVVCTDLEGIGAWGSGNYTPENYDQQWLKECTAMNCDPARGITWDAFKTVL